MKEKQLLPSKGYVDARTISLFVNSELTGEKNILLPEKADNIFDFSLKFEEERNNSLKFCFYGLVESKWGNCDNLKIDFYVGDSSTNSTIGQNSPFWFYDKSSSASGYSWSIQSKGLDFVSGNLTKNIYGKTKGQYLFPFELDLNTITKTNKSLFVSISDSIKNLFDIEEFPFLYFDDENKLLEFGTETAEILDSGTILEIDNNYPFFYDRHWVRREIEPTGPPFIYFTTTNITYDEGTNDPRISQDRIIEVEVALSEKPKGIEKAKVEVVYGLDENLNEYTTVTVPQDVSLNFSNLDWNSSSASTIQTIKIRIRDDFYVEKTERLTLKITPILGLLPHPEFSQFCSIFITDNDVPSKIAFEGQSFQFIEPRQDTTPVLIPLKLSLDQKLLVPNQSVEIYIDSNLTDCESYYGFDTLSGGTGFTEFKTVELNMNDLEYNVDFYFKPKRQYDIRRQIVLKLRNFTSNVIQQSFNQGLSVDYTLYVDKDLDKRYVEIHIPYDVNNGIAVLRSVYNQKLTTNLIDFPTKLSTYYQSTLGSMSPNAMITGNTDGSLLRCLTFEQDFQLNIKNLGTQIIFDNKLYKNGETIVINIYSGVNTSVSSGEFVFNGNEFILKIPANFKFETMYQSYNAPFSIHTFFLGNYSGNSAWGFLQTNYEITIQNNTYNYPSGVNITDGNFTEANILSKDIKIGNYDQVKKKYTFTQDPAIIVNAGIDTRKQIYYLYTSIKNLYTQLSWVQPSNQYVENYSGTSLNYTTNRLFYPSAIIIPEPDPAQFFIVGQYNNTHSIAKNYPTTSQIFITKDKIYLENNFISASNTNPSLKNFPISDFLLPSPLSQYQQKLKIKFGRLYVQAGYSTSTIWLNGFTQPSTSIDSFCMATTSYAGSYLPSEKKQFLFNWNSANINTKNVAYIEILNQGIIPATILGITLNPNEKLWISEKPIRMTTLNGTPLYEGTYNFVMPLDNLEIDFPTNNRFVTTLTMGTLSNPRLVTINNFIRADYKITFSNFVIFNYDGTPANKTVNKSFEMREFVEYDTLGNFVPEQKYVISKYGPAVWVTGSQSTICNNIFFNRKLLTQRTSGQRSVHVNGFIASASINAPLLGIYIFATPAGSTYASSVGCSLNGIIWNSSPNI